MVDIERNVGDVAWVYVSGHKGELVKGTVIMVLNVPSYGYKHYLIEILTCMDPILEIRCGLQISDRKNKPIGMYRKAA